VAERSVEAPAEPGGPVHTPPTADDPALQHLHHLARPRPRVVIKRDLLPAVCVTSVVALFGLPLGWLWSRLAPPQNVWVRENDRLEPVINESFHRLDDLMVFVAIGIGAGVVIGAGTWMLRERRGPVIMLAAALGALAAGYLAQRTGVGWADGLYAIHAAPKVDDVVAKAPLLESWWGLIAWPLGVTLAYGCCAAWNGLDDLGRRLG
jgi:hypothetical protein